MSDSSLNVLLVASSLSRTSHTRDVIEWLAKALKGEGCAVDVLDLAETELPLLNTDFTYQADYYGPLKERIERADVYVLGTPDYHGCMSGGLKNFLDHFWLEFTGKLFAIVVASHEKGLTVHDQIRTAVRQCYAWVLPYGVSFLEKQDVRDGEIATEALRARLEMMVRDIRVYGSLLAGQRAADLKGTDPCFLARLR